MPIDNTLKPAIYSPFDVDMENPAFDWINFKEKYDTVSEPIRNLIFSIDTAVFLKEVSEKISLSENQSADLSRIIRDILLVDLYVGDMAINIASKLQIDQQVAKEVANQIVSQLFTPALEDIKRLQKEKFGDRISSFPSPSIDSGPTQASDTNLKLVDLSPQTSEAPKSFHEQSMSAPIPPVDSTRSSTETSSKSPPQANTGNIIDLKNP